MKSLKEKLVGLCLLLTGVMAINSPVSAEILIPTDTSVGTWVPATRTYTLNTNVSDTLNIVEDNLTLDGNGYSVTGTGTGSGVQAFGRSLVTIKNLNISQFYDAGVFLHGCSNTTVTGNSTSQSINGIYLDGGSDNTITNNACSSNNNTGIVLISSNKNTLTGNTCGSNGWCGIDLLYSTYNTISENTCNLNINCVGIRLEYSSDNNTLTGNTALGNFNGIELDNSNGNTIVGNTCNSNTNVGIGAPGIGNNLSNNVASQNVYGIWTSSNSTISGNTASSNFVGIMLYYSNNNTLTSNTVFENNCGIDLDNSTNNTLVGNTISDNDQGMWMFDASGSKIYNNNFNNSTQVVVSNGSGNVFNLNEPIGGNYWSDWTTPDTNYDRIVDSPYIFTGGQDNLPWTCQDGWTLPPMADSDGDGVPDEVEDANPNGVDGNGDGTADSQQNNVASLPNAADGIKYVTITSTPGTLQNVIATNDVPPPEGVTFPVGLFEFTVSGIAPRGGTTVVLRLPVAVDSYYKYGPRPGEPAGLWEFTPDGETGTTISDGGYKVTLSLVNGKRGDDDCNPDNTSITEPGAPAILAPNQQPTDIALSNTSVPEGHPIDTPVGTLSGTDPDPGQSETLVFSLVDGYGDNSLFSIDPATKQLKTAAVFDYEIKNSYEILVRATDTGSPPLTYDKPFTITVTDVGLTLGDTGWSQPWVGTWDEDTKTGTLTQNVTETITIISDGITLDGAGHTVTGTGEGDGVLLWGRTGVTVKNLKIQSSWNGISVGNSTGNIITGNVAESSTWFGICLWNSTGNILTNNTCNANNSDGICLGDHSTVNTLTSNTCNSNKGNGIRLYESSSGNTLTSNTAELNRWSGIHVDHSPSNTFTNNTNNSNCEGITLSESGGNTLTGNSNSSNDVGIGLYSNSTGNSLSGNTCSSNVYEGIKLVNSGGNTLTSNTTNSNNNGIGLWDSSNNILTGNISESNTLFGIGLWNSTGNTLTGNTCNLNNVDGIKLNNSGNNNLTDNIAQSNNGAGICLDSSNGNGLTGNTCSSNTLFGINLYNSTGNALTRNTCNLNNVDGIKLNNSGNNNLTDNIAESNNGAGICLDSSNGNGLTGNTCSSNTLFGINLYNSTDNELAGNTCNSNNSTPDSKGIHLDNSSDNKLEGNTCNQNSRSGVWLRNSSNGNELNNNTASSNTNSTTYADGINIEECSNNKLIGNVTKSNKDSGIWIASWTSTPSSGNELTGNQASGNLGRGIGMRNCTNSTMTNNQCNLNGLYGIEFMAQCTVFTLTSNTCNSNGQYGIYVYNNSNSNTLAGNMCNLNTLEGIRLQANSNSNSLTDNTISVNVNVGIRIQNCKYNVVSGNTISNNGLGTGLFNNSSANQIYNNNFISNATQASVSGGSGNIFNLSTGGNYWSNWTGPDADSDGFVDSPYVFSGGQDNLPLASTFTEVGSDIEVTPGDIGTGTSPVTLTFGEVTQSGVTTLTISNEGPPPPQGFEVAGVYYYIETTATYTPPVTVCIQYDDTGMNLNDELGLTLAHYQGDALVDDVTNMTVDTDNNTISGDVTSLSPFAILQKDVTAPTITSVSANPNVLWPVNHKMVKVAVTVDCDDNVDPAPVCRIVNVTCNEPVNGPGDGNTQPDWEITGNLTVNLRAERAGSGKGRVYTIHIECKDVSGNTSTATVDVTVPHDQGKGKK